MNFYISFLLICIIMSVFSKNIVTKSGLYPPESIAVGLVFYAEINNTSGEDCSVEAHPDECCLDTNDNKCNIVQIIGGTNVFIPEGSVRTLDLVAPLLEPYNRKGFCTIYVDFKPESRPKKFIRDTIKIKFDTTFNKNNLPLDAVMCKHVDENPLNDCKPVNCDTFYNGRKSFFNSIKKRCVNVPTCQSKTKFDIPKTAYNPISNKCVHEPAIKKEDINFVKALAGGKIRKTKDILIIKTLNKNHSRLSENMPINDESTSKITRLTDIRAVESETTTTAKPQLKLANNMKLLVDNAKLHHFFSYLGDHKYTVLGLIGVVLVQCCLICCLVYYMTSSCVCGKKKKIVSKFFNYRQDLSVTTPLICNSNIDTETTDYQYLSESSNCIDKKIKCYKACQKERKNNVKLSMSDDILSKCITRRDWHRLPRSETILEVKNDEDKNINDIKDNNNDIKKNQEIKVNFLDESLVDKNPKDFKSVYKKTDEKTYKPVIARESSEKLIRCHSYNEFDGNPNSGLSFANFQCKSYGIYNQENPHADSIEKGAQAYFSNDSIDDFLSERGVLFGDRASKYSFTSLSSAGKTSCSSRSSKTSKNNVIKNVMALLKKKTKGPSSDPGVKKSDELNVELLHISRASVCSSTIDTENAKDLRRVKESTSSL